MQCKEQHSQQNSRFLLSELSSEKATCLVLICSYQLVNARSSHLILRNDRVLCVKVSVRDCPCHFLNVFSSIRSLESRRSLSKRNEKRHSTLHFYQLFFRLSSLQLSPHPRDLKILFSLVRVGRLNAYAPFIFSSDRSFLLHH